MKKSIYISSFIILINSINIFAIDYNSDKTIIIDGTRSIHPLVKNWIKEFTEIYPDLNFIITHSQKGQIADLSITAYQPAPDENNYTIVNTGQFALLPVTNEFNPQLSNFAKRGLSKKEIDKLFFDVIDYESDEPVQKSKYPAVIYARDNKAFTSVALAKHFGRKTSEIKGKKVFGDDIFLNTAIKIDSLALTYNTLNNIYDIQTRKLMPGLAILPLLVKSNQKDVFSTNLDAVLSILQSNKIDGIPVENFGFAINTDKKNEAITIFLNWVLTEGQKYNNLHGFLPLNESHVSREIRKIETTFLTQN